MKYNGTETNEKNTVRVSSCLSPTASLVNVGRAFWDFLVQIGLGFEAQTSLANNCRPVLDFGLTAWRSYSLSSLVARQSTDELVSNPL